LTGPLAPRWPIRHIRDFMGQEDLRTGHRRLQGCRHHRGARQAGDVVQPEQSLITVESDKATMEIPSPAAGVVKELRVKAGDKVSKGSLILLLDAAAGAPAAVTPAPKKSPDRSQRRLSPRCLRGLRGAGGCRSQAGASTCRTRAFLRLRSACEPPVRKFARELGVDLVRVKGSGPKGRHHQAESGFVKA